MENHHFYWVHPLFQWLFSIVRYANVYQRVNTIKSSSTTNKPPFSSRFSINKPLYMVIFHSYGSLPEIKPPFFLSFFPMAFPYIFPFIPCHHGDRLSSQAARVLRSQGRLVLLCGRPELLAAAVVKADVVMLVSI